MLFRAVKVTVCLALFLGIAPLDSHGEPPQPPTPAERLIGVGWIVGPGCFLLGRNGLIFDPANKIFLNPLNGGQFELNAMEELVDLRTRQVWKTLDQVINETLAAI